MDRVGGPDGDSTDTFGNAVGRSPAQPLLFDEGDKRAEPTTSAQSTAERSRHLYGLAHCSQVAG